MFVNFLCKHYVNVNIKKDSSYYNNIVVAKQDAF